MRGTAVAEGACEVVGAADGGGGTASADVGVTSAQSSGQRSDLNDLFQLELRAMARIHYSARALPAGKKPQWGRVSLTAPPAE
jgi:hypothetical protein